MALRSLLILLATCSFGAAIAGPYYSAPVTDSHWTVARSALECSLSHTIPYFGRAAFFQAAGGELSFRVQVDRGAARAAQAILRSVPPAWRSTERPTELATVMLKPGRMPVTLERALSQRLVYELESGRFPTLYFDDWAEGSEQVAVALSAVNFRAALAEFHACREALLPFGFDDVRYSTVYFDTDSAALRRDAKGALDRVVQYLAADPAVLNVVIDGYADDRGRRRYNDGLSKKRAEAVKAYLADHGVAEEKLDTRYFGERRPDHPNTTADGRAKNRRVTIRLQL